VQLSPSSKTEFKILSLDGGGIRGAFTASFLAEIEGAIGNPLSQYFDLIAGTSTGAIIAAGIACDIPAATIRDFYEHEGKSVFKRRWWLPWGFVRSKYSAKPLYSALHKVFGEKTLEDAACRLLIPAINLTGDATVIFKTPHQPGFTRDRVRRVVDVLLATTSAPTWFPQAVLHDGTYVDGGLWANNPSMAAYSEAIKIRRVCHRPNIDPEFDVSDIKLLSIGTGKPTRFLQPKAHESGIMWWMTGRKLFDVMGKAQSIGNHHEAQYVLDNNYRRIDFDIPPSGNWSLDSVENIRALIDKGKDTAGVELEQVRRMFLDSARAPYSHFLPPDSETRNN
jgi:uncharacterized protein